MVIQKKSTKRSLSDHKATVGKYNHIMKPKHFNYGRFIYFSWSLFGVF